MKHRFELGTLKDTPEIAYNLANALSCLDLCPISPHESEVLQALYDIRNSLWESLPPVLEIRTTPDD